MSAVSCCGGGAGEDDIALQAMVTSGGGQGGTLVCSRGHLHWSVLWRSHHEVHPAPAQDGQVDSWTGLFLLSICNIIINQLEKLEAVRSAYLWLPFVTFGYLWLHLVTFPGLTEPF